MKINIHKADSRGLADHGWLVSRHTFSFASYYDPERMGFGALRVINDDIVMPSQGFSTHPHENMEIISIPLQGTLRHKDSMGNLHVIEAGEVQIMSAGTGITHSEYNDSGAEDVRFLQIWVLPKERDITPRYDQIRFDPAQRKNQFQLLVSPDGVEGSMWMNQDGYFSMIDLDINGTANYQLHNKNNGVYLFLLSGSLSVEGGELCPRDGAEISGVDRIEMKAKESVELLCMEIPL
jgi:redox-sensitive bicupin YhaK (pirin superfamily)